MLDGVVCINVIGHNGMDTINPLNDKLNPICHLLALLGAHHILHVSRIRVKLNNNNMSYSVNLMVAVNELL